MKKTFNILEYDKIKQMLEKFATSESGREICQQLMPETEIENNFKTDKVGGFMCKNNLPKIIAIVGTNASGKSALAIQLAKKYNGEIISADSRQVYRGFDLCCGKVTQEEREAIPHHLLDVCDIGDSYSVTDYQKEVYSIIPKIIEREHLPIIVGGTGLYISSVVNGYEFKDESLDLTYRKELEAKPLSELQQMLPSEVLSRLRENVSDFNNKRRIIPSLFKWGYGYCKDHPKIFDENSGIYRLLISGSNTLFKYLYDGKFDTVICTHTFSAIMLSYTQKHYCLNIKTAFIATDYHCYPGISSCDLEYYFIPDERFADVYTKCGIPKERLCSVGIPIRQVFFETTPKNEAKEKLKIDTNNKHLLVMCGSMGCGPIPQIIKTVSKILPSNAEVSVICGANKRLYRKLNRKYKANSKIHIVGYTMQVSLYMDAADVYLTKPGGISVTEAAAKNLPMVFVNAVAGCEQYNMDFFQNIGAAITANSPKKLAVESIRLLNQDSKRNDMAYTLKNFKLPNGAAGVYNKLYSENRIAEIVKK